MSTIPTLSESDIRNRVGDQTFQRGVGYFRNEAITSPRREGSTIKARCWGTADEPYRVAVSFADGQIDHAECSCPVGHGGFCKHVAALLLAWQAHPADFVEVEELGAALERRTKPELIALLDQMLRRDPDLETLLELPLPRKHRLAPPADRDAFRRQAAAVFHRHPPGEWGVEGVIADELLIVGELGDGFAARDDISSAAAVFESLALEVIANYEDYPYDEGELSGVIDDSVESLAGLLDRPDASPEDRRSVLESLVAIYRANLEDAADFEIGGSSAIDVVVRKATPAERSVVAGWIRSAIAETDNNGDQDSSFADDYGDVLYDLEKDTYDDETFLAASRERGRVADLVDRLLLLNRVDEAVMAAKSSANGRLPEVLDRFVGRGHADLAEDLARQRTSASPDPAILTWQKQRYAQKGDQAGALSAAEQVFRIQPSLTLYAEIRGYAEQLGRWEAVRDGLRSRLRDSHNHDLLVEAYLDDDDIRMAVAEVLHRSDAPDSQMTNPPLGGTALKVAAAAESTQPLDAIEIYARYAEQLIEHRGRGSYQAACTTLRNVKRLYHRLGETSMWHDFVANLRARHRKLRALQEELSAADL